MKKIALLMSCLFITGFLQALTVVSTAGGLSSAITAAGGTLDTITNLTVTGTIDARDFLLMKTNMPVLTEIDLSEATIDAYTGTEGTNGTKSYVYNKDEIPAYAFYGESDLIAITIPSSANKIGYGAFGECTSLKTITFSSLVFAIGGYAFYGCTALTTITLPSPLKTIGTNGFAKCSGLTSINIPPSITYIGTETFSGCSGLTSIYAYSTTPVDLSSAIDAFDNVNVNICTLYVPKGTIDLYKAEFKWKDFILMEEM